MRTYTCFQAFSANPVFLRIYNTEYSDGMHDLLGPHVLSGMNVFFPWADHTPARIDTWYAWKDVMSQKLEKETQNSQDVPDIYNQTMTWEQGFIAAFFFLNDYYWEHNHDVIIYEVVNDLDKHLSLGNGLFDTVLWKEWTKCVKKAMEYNFEYE
jgi:hypothetical protein